MGGEELAREDASIWRHAGSKPSGRKHAHGCDGSPGPALPGGPYLGLVEGRSVPAAADPPGRAAGPRSATGRPRHVRQADPTETPDGAQDGPTGSWRGWGAPPAVPPAPQPLFAGPGVAAGLPPF